MNEQKQRCSIDCKKHRVCIHHRQVMAAVNAMHDDGMVSRALSTTLYADVEQALVEHCTEYECCWKGGDS